MLLRLLLLVLFFGLICDSHVRASPSEVNNIILITLDGVRWQDLFDGKSPAGFNMDSRKLYPNIYRYFVDNGMAFGKDSEVRVANPAHVSMPGYLEIMRGYPSIDCFDNECQPNLTRTLVNEFPSAAVFSSWDLIDHIIDDSPAVNTGRYHRNQNWINLGLPDDKGFPEAFGENYRPDEFTGKAASEYYNKFHPQFLWISFGDTDEYAHAGDYPGYVNALQRADVFIGRLMKSLPKNTTVIVSPDHGRGSDWRHHGWDSESGKAWLLMSGNKVPAIGFVKGGTIYLFDIYNKVMLIKKS